MQYDIRHNAEASRFETRVDEATALTEYRIEGDQLNILHTLVPRAIEGRGIASALVKAAYDYALCNGLIPTATCSYAIAWLDRHPDYKKAPNKER